MARMVCVQGSSQANVDLSMSTGPPQPLAFASIVTIVIAMACGTSAAHWFGPYTAQAATCSMYYHHHHYHGDAWIAKRHKQQTMNGNAWRTNALSKKKQMPIGRSILLFIATSWFRPHRTMATIEIRGYGPVQYGCCCCCCFHHKGK
ncbi:hypothetical protein THASP1DRAFT_26711 [Thamnocephalis sphaerospora]|uniref:Uncharacterized protein n=1 Tax=Thamnocephalis sphaerospora TaxID=78915 RepID=A0A4V1IVN7_9FUNG|nr:hypothetical protein THASP1DRAFT_26711 [Thamnocephalis sphaerospora]|eukprot:RKP04699.1 hypothetical protein THASP1DRAFT_26711 [Thamnocephalis sphaerospora]